MTGGSARIKISAAAADSMGEEVRGNPGIAGDEGVVRGAQVIVLLAGP
jgi:hypothetical protein